MILNKAKNYARILQTLNRTRNIVLNVNIKK